MSKPEGYVPSRDSTMNDLYSLAISLGPPPKLPDSLNDEQYTAKFLDYMDNEKIGDLYRSLSREEFILKAAELTREKIPDVTDGKTRVNITCRLYAGGFDSAKTIRDTYVHWYPNGTKEDRPIPPEEREKGWHQHMGPRSEEDALYKFGVELGPLVKKYRGQSVYLEGIPKDSIIRRHVRAGKEGDAISPEDIVTSSIATKS